MIPERELFQILAAGILEALHEVFDRCRVAIVALEIEVHTLLEGFATQNRLDHAVTSDPFS